MITVRKLYQMGFNRTVINSSAPFDVPIEQLQQNAEVLAAAFEQLGAHVGGCMAVPMGEGAARYAPV
jgi:hypothetical protein